MVHLDILTLLLIFGNMVFMGLTLFYYENLWLFLLSLFLMFLFVYFRREFNNYWYNRIGYTLEKQIKEQKEQ